MESSKKCGLYSDGRCRKIDERCKCRPSTIEWFDEPFGKCDVEEVCRKDSIFGNDYFYITDADIEALKSGKVLCSIGEYGTFIVYRAEEALKDADN